jgi:hypothetical protein
MLRRLEEVGRIGDRFLEFVRRLKVRTPSTVSEIAAARACGVTLLAFLRSCVLFLRDTHDRLSFSLRTYGGEVILRIGIICLIYA